MVRKNKANLAPKGDETADTIHEDLLVMYRPPGVNAFKAIYFDSEGHVINYTVSFPAAPNSIILESAASPGVPSFRLVYILGTDGVLTSEFFIAPPGNDFQKYLTGKQKRQ